MIVVDTSVWVDALRGRAPAQILTKLLDADEVALALPVRLELLAGTSRRDRAPLKRALTGVPVVMPTEDTWKIVGRFVESAAERGQHFGLTDLLVAALADEHSALVWSIDADFARMSDAGLVQLYAA